MDPLSIIGSIASLSGLVGGAAKGVRKLLATKNAPQILQQLNNELSYLNLVVSKVEDVCRQHLSSEAEVVSTNEIISAAVTRAKEAILDLEKMVVYDLQKIWDGNNQKPDRISLMRNKENVKEMKERLRNAMVDLLLAVNVNEMQWRTTVQVHLGQLKISNESHHQKLETMIRAVLSSPQLPALQLASDFNPRVPESSLGQLVMSPAHERNVSIEASSISSPPKYLGIMRNTACGSFCPCVCHNMKQLRSPSLLDQVLGVIFVGYSALPFMTKPCDSPRCKRERISTTTVSYIFPPWFLERFITMKIRIPEPELLLRVLRVRPNDSEIFSAIRRQDKSMVRRLIKTGQASALDVNGDGESLISIFLLCAISHDNDFLRGLVDLGIDMWQQDARSMSTYLHFWLPTLTNYQSRNIEQRTIFGGRLQLDYFGFAKLHAAVLDLELDGNSPEAVINKTSREAINELDLVRRSALSWASGRGSVSKIEMLLRKGADPNIADNEGRTSLHHFTGSEQGLEMLLSSGAAVKARNRQGGAPLHCSTFSNNCTVGMLEKFVQFGADINARDRNGWTPLHWTVRNGTLELIDRFVQYGADANVLSDLGSTPLTYALSRHQYQTFRYLLQNKLDYTIKNQYGSTLLRYVARDADLATLRFLHQSALSNLNPEDRDEDGFTALERAERRRDGAVDWTDLLPNEASPDPEPILWFDAFVKLHQKFEVVRIEDDEQQRGDRERCVRRYRCEYVNAVL